MATTTRRMRRPFLIPLFAILGMGSASAQWAPSRLVANYSTFIGATTDAFYDSVNAVTTDSNGNVYLAGLTQFDANSPVEAGFPTTPGSLRLANPRSPNNDCAFQCGYILKLNSNHEVVYGALFFGLEIKALAVDANGNAYATGHTLTSTNFPATPGAFANDPVGQAFAIKLNAEGSALVYAALFRAKEGRAIAVDSLGNAYVAGEADQPGLPATPGALKPNYQATGDRINVDAFLLKINPGGSGIVFGTYLGGADADTAYGITLTSDNRAVVVGRSFSNDFVGMTATSAGEGDAFIARIATDGSAIDGGRFLGGSADDAANAVAADGQGGYLIAGATHSVNFPVTAGTVQQRLLGSRNGWLARLDANLSTRYSTYFGGSFIDGFLGVVGDASGRAYAIGTAFSSDLMTSSNGFQDVSASYTGSLLAGMGPRFYPLAHDAVREAYFGVFSADGASLEYGTYLGGYYTVPRSFAPLTFGSSIARAPDGSIYVGGSSSAASFPTLGGGLSNRMKGGSDGFLTHFAARDLSVSTPTLLPAARLGQPYTYQLQAAGGTAPYRWELAAFQLPDGLQLASSGQITGTAANPQTESWGYQFSVKVTDAVGLTASKSVFINIHWPGNPYCTPSTCTMSVLQNQQFIYDPPFLARGVPPFTLFISGSLPPGIILNQVDATVSGNPTTPGNYSFSLRMVDAVGAEGTIGWQIEVRDPNPPPAPPPTSNPPPSSSGTGGGGGGGDLSGMDLLVLLAILALARSARRSASVNNQSAASAKGRSMRILLTTAATLFLLLSGAARADWHEASSDHFVIYADESEKEIRKYSDRLERYYSAMTFVIPSRKTKPSPSNRVTVYVVRSERIVRKLHGGDSRYLQGFYIPRAGGSLAIIPPIDVASSGNPSQSELVLMHEYAHHFMAENAPYLVPRWYGEGFAEYFATAKFESDGAVGLGLPAQHRAYELFQANDVSIERLLDSKLYEAKKTKSYDNFYGRSWLLFHYLFTDSDRRKLVVDYLNRLNRGEAELAAATAAFGDLKALDKALDAYVRQKKMQYIRVPPDRLSVGQIAVRKLSEAEGASMAVRIRSKRGVDEKTAPEVVVEAREVAKKYPDEPAVQAALAEAEFDVGDDEAAIAAADKALAAAPENMTALIQKGYALTRVATEKNTEEAWKAARKHFVTVNRIENDHPIPLIYYYLSFLNQDQEPNQAALDGLEWALELAPYDGSVRMMVAARQMQDKRFAHAVRTISPLAYHPHAGADNPAMKLLEKAREGLAAEPKAETATR